MKAVSGYYEKGKFIPSEAISLPRRVRAVLVFDESESPSDATRPLTEHAKNWDAFLKGIRACNEPLDAEFDQVMSERVNFTREFTV